MICLCGSSRETGTLEGESRHLTGQIPGKSSGKGHGLDSHLLSAGTVLLFCEGALAEVLIHLGGLLIAGFSVQV